MKAIRTIYLAWRKGKGCPRRVVGLIKRSPIHKFTFSYITDGVQAALKEGFTPYIDFPDLNKVYSENIIEVFGQRLIKQERSDSQKYLDFWAIDPKFQDDKFYLLAYTQGMLPTDNFEFLAEFHPVRGLSFVSEICGLSFSKLQPGIVEVGDKLTWVLEKDNPRDKFAVKVFKKDTFVGYIKLIHSRVFHWSKIPLKIIVKSIDQNGSVNRIFVLITY